MINAGLLFALLEEDCNIIPGVFFVTKKLNLSIISWLLACSPGNFGSTCCRRLDFRDSALSPEIFAHGVVERSKRKCFRAGLSWSEFCCHLGSLVTLETS